ncbi:MAG: hypothetical protein IPG33_11925 [Betaproteobacteria bacterium]|nr:hypothetical protein [Betaproteobacteria bacterium]
MNMAMPRLQHLRDAGGWRRAFVAGVALLAIVMPIFSWHVLGEEWGVQERIEHALTLWSIGALALAAIVSSLAAIDCGSVWVGRGFGLSSTTTRIGMVAVLAGLTLLGAVAMLTRYETIMPEGGSMRTGELCVVLDRWTGKAYPCTEEAVVKRYRSRPQPQRVEEESRNQAVWRQIIGIVVQFIGMEKWLTNMTGRI